MKAQLLREDMEEVDDNEDEDDYNDSETSLTANGSDSGSASTRARLVAQAGKVRTLALLRLGELVHQYPVSILSSENEEEGLIMEPLKPLLLALPTAVPHAPRPSALLLLLDALSGSDDTITLLLKSPPAITAIISSIAQSGLKCDHSVRVMLLTLLNRLLEADNGVTLHPYASQIVDAFTMRFSATGNGAVVIDEEGVGAKFDPMSVTISTTSLHHEIHLLCALSERIFMSEMRLDTCGDDKTSNRPSTLSSDRCYNLACLLLAMLVKFTSPDARRKMFHVAGGTSYSSSGGGRGSGPTWIETQK